MIRITEAEYKGESILNFDELFDANTYDTLYAVTYSSTFDVIYDLAKRFAHTEIVFGCGKTMTGKISAVFASQKTAVNLMKESKHFDEMVQMIHNGKLKLYLLSGRVSHDKMYLMSGENGHTCVLEGSANMSAPALKGVQEEGLVRFLDDDAAYNQYLKYYLKDRNDSSMNFDPEVLNIRQTDPTTDENVPVFAVVTKEKEVKVPVPVSVAEGMEEDEDFQFVRDVSEMLPDDETVFDTEIRLPVVKDGVRRYRNDSLVKALTNAALADEEDEKIKKEYAKFVVDSETGHVTLNGGDFNVAVEEQFPDKTAQTDLEGLDQYMQSFDKFRGDEDCADQMRDLVWKLLCYAFASPFFCRLRRAAIKNGYMGSNFPMYALIDGRSDSSKTVMTRVIMRLMAGQEITGNDSDKFTSTSLLRKLKAYQVGLPIFINDLTKEQWSAHAGKILKQDNFEIRNPKYDCPVTIMTTNDVPSLKEEESKRCVLLRTSAVLDKSVALSMAKQVSDLLDSLSPHLYLKYLEQMAPAAADMEKKIKLGDSDYFPDIMALSSSVLKNVCMEETGSTYSWMKDLTIVGDFLGDNSVGKTRIAQLVEYWQANPEMFTFRKNGRVDIEFEKSWEANRYKDELPRWLCYDTSGKKLICFEDGMNKIGIRKPLLKRRK